MGVGAKQAQTSVIGGKRTIQLVDRQVSELIGMSQS